MSKNLRPRNKRQDMETTITQATMSSVPHTDHEATIDTEVEDLGDGTFCANLII